MKKLFSVVAAALVCGMACASPVDTQRAEGMARKCWNTIGGKADATLVLRSWDFADIYLFTADGGGFVMVAADDCAQPILGYSPSEPIDPQQLPVQLHEWLEAYAAQIDRCREHGGVVHPGWDDASFGGIAPKGHDGLDDVAPLTTTLWDQQYPYNQLCPGGTVTGCAATAQAQLMKYWNYPAFGNGRHSYNHATYGAQTADFGHTVYGWDVMSNNASFGSAEERLAVATLMYHVGVSLDMHYASAAQGGSAAAGLAGVPGYASMDNSLKDYFFYNPNMQVIGKSAQWPDERWADTLAAELQHARPILYQGQSNLGGHGFICDGCEWRSGEASGDRWFFHFNFGWSGMSNGYYPIGAITPPYGGAGSAGLDFSQQNAALLRCMPDYAARVSDSVIGMSRDGGRDSVIFGINELDSTAWTITADQPWLVLDPYTFDRAGWVKFTVDENTTGATRTAHITLNQGANTVSMRVVQAHFSDEDLCQLKVVMQSTNSQGWAGGAYLSFESADGFIFNTATMSQAVAEETTYVGVGDHDVKVVYHSGGAAADRKINYFVYNGYDEELVAVTYAFINGGTHLISWPCVRTGIDEVGEAELAVWPNPSRGNVTVAAEGLERVQLTDLAGRTIAECRAADGRAGVDMSALVPGVYIVRAVTPDGVLARRIVRE